MNARIAILAALPRELAPLVRDWPVRLVSRPDRSSIWECERAIAVCAGMGPERVTHALALAEDHGPLTSIISVGYAGALRAGIERNTIYWPGKVIDARTGDSYNCNGGSGILVTTDRVLGHEEKPTIAERWGADLVDMEAAVVARLAQERGLPFRTLRVVSDELGDVLPDLNRFIDARGGFRETPFALHLALHPRMIPNAIRLGRHSAEGSRTLARALREVLEYAG